MILIFLGPPGAGKGTVAQFIIEEHGLVRISTGDILRSAIEAGTNLGKEAATYMDKGELVPDHLVISLIENAFTPKVLEKGVILDGFPRTLNQAKILDELLANLNQRIDQTVLIEVDREELIQRMQARRTCSNPECQAVYSVRYSPPQQAGICDKCSSELITRSDQSRDVIENRLDVYEQKTEPLISYYEDKGLLKRYSHPDSKKIAQLIMSDLKITN